MHIPDGFLSATTCAVTWAVSVGGVGYCLRRAAREIKDRTVPLMGVMSAFIFAAQMVNFPVMAGTSGHLLGGVLATVLLGPHVGVVVLSCVLVFQCFIFQDGGLTALGANTLNMALVGSGGGYLIYALIRRVLGNKHGTVAGTALAAWFSVVLAAAFCAVELALSGTSPLWAVLPAMAAVHMVVGVGEALITVAVIGFIQKTRPDLIYLAAPASVQEGCR